MLLNAWDAGSARLFEARGAAAIGTTSAGVAFALGRRTARSSATRCSRRPRASPPRSSVPVTADIESGFGETPEDVGETVERVLAAGAVGINLEDSAMHGDEPLLPVARGGRARRRRARRRRRAPASGCSSTRAPTSTGCVSARSPRGSSARSSGSRPTSRRARTASSPPASATRRRSGGSPASCARRSTSSRARRCRRSPSSPRLGVARVSSGSGPSRATLGLAARIADEFLGAGGYGGDDPGRAALRRGQRALRAALGGDVLDLAYLPARVDEEQAAQDHADPDEDGERRQPEVRPGEDHYADDRGRPARRGCSRRALRARRTPRRSAPRRRRRTRCRR